MAGYDSENGRVVMTTRVGKRRGLTVAGHTFPVRELLVVGLFLLAGVALRVWLRLEPLGGLDSDEAVVGLMARHVLEGEFPAFFWGQAYGGSAEAFVTAPVFAAFGSGTLALKMVQSVLYAVAGLLVWRVGRHTVGENAARVGALAFWIAPAAFVHRSNEALGIYNSGLVLGLAALLLIVRSRERATDTNLLLLGLCIGTGWWVNPQVVFVVAPALVWLALRNPEARSRAGLLAPGVIVGALPWIVNNLTHDWHFFGFISGESGASSYLSRLSGFFTGALPIALGFKAETTQEWVVPAPVGIPLVVGAIAAVLVLMLRRHRGMEVLLVIAGTYPLMYAASSFTAYVADARYLYMLSPVTALLIGYALARWRLRVVGLAVILVMSCAGLAITNGYVESRIGTSDDQPPIELTDSITVLEDEGLDRVFTDYWVAYKLTFESGEEIIASPIGHVRYLPYNELVVGSPVPAYVFVTGTEGAVSFERALADREISYSTVDAAGLTAYLPERKILPPAIPEVRALMN
jgi:hypothetical protein